MEIDQALLGEDAFAVNAKDLRRLKVAVNRAIAQDLLHKLSLRGGTPAAANLVRLGNFADGLA